MIKRPFVLMICLLTVSGALAAGGLAPGMDTDEAPATPGHLAELMRPLQIPEVTAEGGTWDTSKTTCNPVFYRYPVAGRHNHGYDSYWWSWTCGTTNSNSDFHYGNDIFGARGTPIVAAQPGTISYSFLDDSGGHVVYIVDDCGWWHYYAHLDAIDPGLYLGQYVMAGTRLGILGNSGSAWNTEPHLHYSTYPGYYYSGIDPYPYLASVETTACESGNPCSCLDGINVDGYTIPVTDTDCGHRVCGVANELFECGASWSRISGAGSCSNACSCPGGRFENGRIIPEHMTHCGFRVCGMDHQYWDCTTSGWQGTGQSCY